MGVTYKFKQEVVDFILQQKKATPLVSCRRLTTIVRDHFHLEVSKSAVNTVLKANRLSSPVGRHPKSTGGKNFFIPQEKKDELRANLSVLLSSVIDNPQANLSKANLQDKDNLNSAKPDTASSNQVRKSDSNELITLDVNVPKEDQDSDVGGIEGISQKQPQQKTITNDLKPHSISDLVMAPPMFNQGDESVRIYVDPNIGRKCILWEDESVVEHDQAIAVLLMAQIWEMDNERILGKTLSKVLNDHGKRFSLDLIEGALLLMQNEKDIPKDIRFSVISSLAEMFGVDSAELDEAYNEITKFLSTNLQASLFFESTWDTLSTKAACFELITRDGHKLYVDPLWTQISKEPIIESSRAMFLYHALNRLAIEFINNIEPLDIYITDKNGLFESTCYDLLPLIVGLQNDYIDAVSILSLRGDILASFTRLPKIRRGFVITGTLFDSALGPIDFDNIGDTDNFYSPVDGNNISYHEGRVKIGEDDIFSARVFKSDNEHIMNVIISNLKDFNFSNYFLFYKYMDNYFYDNKLILNKKFCIKDNKDAIYIRILDFPPSQSELFETLFLLINRRKIFNIKGQKLLLINYVRPS